MSPFWTDTSRIFVPTFLWPMGGLPQHRCYLALPPKGYQQDPEKRKTEEMWDTPQDGQWPPFPFSGFVGVDVPEMAEGLKV